MAKRRRDSWLPELFFIAGALLILITFGYLLQRWPTFDPLVTSLLAGIGLMLIVIYERLGLMLKELRRLTASLDRDDEDVAAPVTTTDHATAGRRSPSHGDGAT